MLGTRDGAEAERAIFFRFRFGVGLRSDAGRCFTRRGLAGGDVSSGDAGRLVPMVARPAVLGPSGRDAGWGAGPGPGLEPSLDQLSHRRSWHETFSVGGSNREIVFLIREGLVEAGVMVDACGYFCVFLFLFFDDVDVSGDG